MYEAIMERNPESLSRPFIAALVLLMLATLGGGVWFYGIQHEAIRIEVNKELTAIAQLKASQIVAWRRDQIEDAASMQAHPFLSKSVISFMAEKSGENERDLRARLRSLADQHGYSDMLLVAPDGKPLLSLVGPVDSHTGYVPALAEALRDRKPAFTELLVESQGAPPHISIIVPLFNGIEPEKDPIAALVLVNDASRFLYPLIQSWPIPSETSETLLVRRDGEDVLFLNDLRHQPDSALKLRIPLSQTDTPAVMAVLGKQGAFQGKDYRGVEVVSVILPIPDSQWFMIAKIDVKEAFAEWRFRSALILGLLFGIMVFIMTAGLFFWQRDKKAQYRALYESEAALYATAERHSITLKAIGDAVIATDARGAVELLNPVAEALTGWKSEEACGRPLEEVFRIVNEDTGAKAENPVAKVLREGVVIGLANHTLLISRDGARRPIADSGAPIRDDGGRITGVVLVFRDQSAERAAQESLRRSTERQRFLADIIENAQQPLAVGYPDGHLGIFNRGFCELTGYEREELKEIDWNETLTPPEWRESEAAVLAKIVRDGKPARYEKEYLRKDGTRVPIEMLVHAIKNETGEIQYYYAFISDITERRKAEEELKLSHANFYRAFSSSPAALAITRSEDGKFIIINDSYSRMMGYQEEEIIGRTVADIDIFVHADERARLVRELREKGSVRDHELSVRDKTGSILHLLVSMEPTVYDNEAAIISTFIDITKQKEAGLRIDHLNRVLRALRDVNQLITHEKDGDRLLRRACGILTETRGYVYAWIGIRNAQGTLSIAAESGASEEFDAARTELERGWWPECCRDAVGASGVIVVHDTARQCRGCPISRNNPGAAALAAALRYSEREYGVLVVSLPADMSDNVEERSLFMELAGDIAFGLYSMESERERERALADLRNSEARYRALFEASADGILIADAETRAFRYANPAICRFLGYTERELTGMSVKDLHREADLPGVMADFEAQMNGVKALAQEIPCRRKDGAIVFADVNASSITLEGRACMLGFFRDVSERRRAEAERGKLQAQLIQAQKMESVGRLAGGVAHDYNNIIGVIIGYTDLAMEKVGAEDPLREDLKEIHTAANRSRDITRQLLAFARKETIAPEILDLNANVESMLKILRKLIGEDIDLVWRPGQAVWPILMDPSQVDQILANLCVNARDAIADVGRITIETGTATIDADYCSEHEGFVPGDFALLVVSDDGCGMDRETMANIFEPFFTTKGLGKGTGLGLSTVYGIVKQNNGFINVYSEKGSGTRFSIYLPRHSGDISVKQKAAVEEVPNGDGETILVVEDEISILRLVERILSPCDYKVLLAKSPSEALGVARSHAGEIALLITDVVMPEMNGRELAEKIKILRPGLKCLFMSGYTADIIAHRGVLDEGVHFIQKPFSAKGLAAKVSETLKLA
jgi:PAS domain S-box-containing protein